MGGNYNYFVLEVVTENYKKHALKGDASERVVL